MKTKANEVQVDLSVACGECGYCEAEKGGEEE